MNYTPDFLRDNPAFWSRLGFFCDPTILGDDGEVLCFTDDHRKFADYHDSFAKAGVKVHTFILHCGWVGVDKYDYRLTDRVLDEFFKNNPDSLVIPRVKLNVPVEWCAEYPEETFVYYEGLPYRTPEQIKSLVGGERQDWLGYVSDTGPYRGGSDPRLARPNRNSLIALQSFSSEQWRRDAWNALERFIDHVDARYPERIIGYHIAYGAQGESMPWGRGSDHYGDYGIANLRHFYDFALEKYGSHGAIESAWGFEFSPDTVFLPSPEERYFKRATLGEFFREKCEIDADYDEFTAQVNSSALIYFCRKVKEKNGRLTGGFYGYSDYMHNANYAGHLGIGRVLDSEYVDFLAAPKSYYRCGIGDSGGFMCPVDSINKRKLWLDELDNRTHLCVDASAFELAAKTPEDTECVLLRELAKNLSHGSSFWWMDLGGGWYDSPELMQTIARMTEIKRRLDAKKRESIADVLVLTDELGLKHVNANDEFIRDFNRDLTCELALSGVIYDRYRLADLPELDLSRYKLVIFAYCFEIGSDTRRMIDRLVEKGVHVMFNYASGIRCDGKFDVANVTELTGFEIVQDGMNGNYPSLAISSGDKYTKLASSGGRILNVTPRLGRDTLARIAREAGCRIYCECGRIVYGDNRFIGIFSGEGTTELALPRRGDWLELVDGEEYRGVGAVVFESKPSTAKIFVRREN